MIKPPRHPYFWLACVFLWFGVLWYLSSKSDPLPEMPKIPHFDKVQHFGYFLGGGGLFSAYLFRRNPERPRWLLMLALTFLLFGLVGALDELHQTHTAGRSGNDPFDWFADVSGALSGCLIFRRLHWLLK